MSEGLNARVWGTGPRTVVLLHGSTSSSSTWWHVGPRLADSGWTVTAFDLPSHGRSPAAGVPLTPQVAAAAVRHHMSGTVDALLGHSFGAAVAATLAATSPGLTRRLVLEELPGPTSVDWAGEARAVVAGAADARHDREGSIGRTRRDQPRWAEDDCRHAVDDLAACNEQDVAAGLLLGDQWLPTSLMRQVSVPVLLVLGPDAPGVNELDDATALRGTDRRKAQAILPADTVIRDAGHCIHRDDPAGWLQALSHVP